MSIPATYVQATPDLMMGDLLKTMRSSQIFSVCGLPEVKLRKLKGKGNGASQYRGRAAGRGCLRSDRDEARASRQATTYRHGCSIPTTTAYASMYRRHSSRAPAPGTTSRRRCAAPTTRRYGIIWRARPAHHSRQAITAKIAVKVIDDRGNELMVVKSLNEAR